MAEPAISEDIQAANEFLNESVDEPEVSTDSPDEGPAAEETKAEAHESETPAAPTTEADTEAAAPAPAPKVEDKPLTPQEAWRLRDMRRQLQEERNRAQQYAQYVEAIVRGQQPQAPQAPQEEQEDPVFDGVDPQVQQALRYYTTRLAQENRQHFESLIAPFYERQQYNDQLAQQQAEVESQRQQTANYLAEIDSAEKEYAASPEGQGYYDRLGTFREARTAHWAKLGIDQAAIPQLIAAEFIGLAKTAAQYQIHPAVFVDHEIKALLAGRAPKVEATAPVQPPAKPAASQQVQRAAAAQASGLTGKARATATPSTDPLAIDMIMERGIPQSQLEKWSREGTLVDNLVKLDRGARGAARG